MEITLKKPKIETLRVNIGDAAVEIPLGNSLTLEQHAGLETFEGTVRFFNEYIPSEVAKTLTIDEYNQITTAWIEATKKFNRNKSVGE